MFVRTLNKTMKSLALAKIGAEYVLRWLPPGTHDWSRFVEPRRLRELLEEAGLHVLRTQGVSFDPLAWEWKLSRRYRRELHGGGGEIDSGPPCMLRAPTQRKL